MIAVALPCIAIILWFARGNMVFFIDSYFPFSPVNNLWQLSGAWSDYNGVGTLSVSNLPLEPFVAAVTVLSGVFQIPLNAAQALVFAATEIVASSFMYAFVRSNSFSDARTAKIAATAAAVFYGVNPVFLVLYWYLNFPGVAGVFAAAPALGYFLQKGVQKAILGSFNLRAITGVAVTSVIAATSVVPYVLSAAVLFVTLSVALAVPLVARTSPHRPLVLWFLLASVSVIFLSNCYWILPQAAAAGYVGGPNAYNTSSGLNDLSYNSTNASPFSVATFQYFPAWNQFGHWASLYSGSAVFEVVIPALILAVIFISLLGSDSANEKFSNRAILPTFTVAFLILIFTISGSNPLNPFASIYLDLFTSNVFLVPFLRGPYLTFGAAYAFTGSVLFGIGTAIATRRLTRLLSPPHVAKNRTKYYRWRSKAKANRVALVVVPVILIVVCSGLFSFPFWTGEAVSDLQYPATPVVPQSAYSTGTFLRDNLQGASAIVFPATTGYTLENWSEPYLGPPILPFSGVSVLEDVNPPLGSEPNYIIPMTFALPSYNNSPTYGHLLQLLGQKYAVIDNSAGTNSLTLQSNMNAIRWTLGHTSNLSLVEDDSGYSIYQVANFSPRVTVAHAVIPDNLTSGEELDISQEYAQMANNSTDLSAEGLWSSTAQISEGPSPGFNISAYWPSPSVRSTRGTGFHYPGWAEVTNLQPLDIPVGRYPLIYVWIKTVSSQVSPVVWFSSVSSLKEFVSNISSYDRTLDQFFVPNPVQALSEDGGTLYVYNLASESGISSLVGGTLNHIMIEVQPVGNYFGSLNASVRLGIGSPPFLDPGFDPSTTVLVNQSAYPGALAAVGHSAPSLSFSEVSPSQYDVTVRGASEQFVLVFLQTYDKNWGLTLPSDDSATHFVAQDFANGWIVNTSQSSFTFTIFFSLQQLVTYGWTISLVTLASLPVLSLLQAFGVMSKASVALFGRAKH